MLGIIRTLNYSFSTIDSLLLLLLVRPVLEYAPPVWSSIVATHATKLERNQRKSATFLFQAFFLSLSLITIILMHLRFLKLDALKVKGQQVDAVF
jgi:hypothetical protein